MGSTSRSPWPQGLGGVVVVMMAVMLGSVVWSAVSVEAAQHTDQYDTMLGMVRNLEHEMDEETDAVEDAEDQLTEEDEVAGEEDEDEEEEEEEEEGVTESSSAPLVDPKKKAAAAPPLEEGENVGKPTKRRSGSRRKWPSKRALKWASGLVVSKEVQDQFLNWARASGTGKAPPLSESERKILSEHPEVGTTVVTTRTVHHNPPPRPFPVPVPYRIFVRVPYPVHVSVPVPVPVAVPVRVPVAVPVVHNVVHQVPVPYPVVHNVVHQVPIPVAHPVVHPVPYPVFHTATAFHYPTSWGSLPPFQAAHLGGSGGDPFDSDDDLDMHHHHHHLHGRRHRRHRGEWEDSRGGKKSEEEYEAAGGPLSGAVLGGGSFPALRSIIINNSNTNRNENENGNGEASSQQPQQKRNSRSPSQRKDSSSGNESAGSKESPEAIPVLTSERGLPPGVQVIHMTPNEYCLQARCKIPTSKDHSSCMESCMTELETLQQQADMEEQEQEQQQQQLLQEEEWFQEEDLEEGEDDDDDDDDDDDYAAADDVEEEGVFASEEENFDGYAAEEAE